MKLKHISAEDAAVLKAARKVLEKLVKKYGKLRERSGRVPCEREEPHYRMYKELMSLKVDIGIDGIGKEIVQLSLSSNAWELEGDDDV